MIYVSQGHELGIGLEVFFRSLAFFSKPEQRKFTLIIETNEAKKYQAFLESTAIHLYTFKKSQKSLTAESLIIALEKIKAKDILITLPTSKDQLVINSTQHFGYTDFFRNQFKTSLPMCFKFNHTYYAILTDHIPLKKVSDEIDLASTQEKIEVLRSGIHKYYGKLDDIFR